MKEEGVVKRWKLRYIFPKYDGCPGIKSISSIFGPDMEWGIVPSLVHHCCLYIEKNNDTTERSSTKWWVDYLDCDRWKLGRKVRICLVRVMLARLLFFYVITHSLGYHVLKLL